MTDKKIRKHLQRFLAALLDDYPQLLDCKDTLKLKAEAQGMTWIIKIGGNKDEQT